MAFKKNNKQTHVQTLLIIFILTLFTGACGMVGSSNDNLTFPSQWLVNENEIVEGGPGVDGIPSIENPKFIKASEAVFLDPNRRVAGIKVGNEVKAYPHQIMDQHEIVNDNLNEEAVTITFCPLTGTSIAASRVLNGRGAEFGVSGLLFRNNLIMYDRLTESFWSQIQLRSIGGDLAGEDLEVIQMVETTWGLWRKMYPDSEVLSDETGFGRNYNTHLYGSDFTTNHNRIIFPVRNNDERLQRKDRVHALIPSNADETANVIAFVIKEFGNSMTIKESQFMGKEVIAVGNNDLDIINTFYLISDFEKSLIFEPIDGELPIVMQDQLGNKWDIFGHAIEGPNTGEKLTETRSFTGYWYALADFYPNIEI